MAPLKLQRLACRAAPFGHLQVLGVGGVCFALRLEAGLVPPSSPGNVDSPELLSLLSALETYLADPKALLPVPRRDLGTPFQQRVWDAIRQIPSGQSRTYAEIAAQLDSHPRAVAGACGANPFPLLTPCHRVVSTHGLGGFQQGVLPASLAIKRWLLDHESLR